MGIRQYFRDKKITKLLKGQKPLWEAKDGEEVRDLILHLHGLRAKVHFVRSEDTKFQVYGEHWQATYEYGHQLSLAGEEGHYGERSDLLIVVPYNSQLRRITQNTNLSEVDFYYPRQYLPDDAEKALEVIKAPTYPYHSNW